MSKELGYYERGATTLFASRFDQRCSYCLYVPQSYTPHGTTPLPLVVLVHGTHRSAQRYRDSFADFAESNACLVLAPLFPAGIEEPGELSNYKFIRYRDIRFDHVLLGIIDEVGETYRVDTQRFCLFGFSGGAHFAHRFAYLHPQRLRAVSIVAPGMVTVLDFEQDWWCGVRDLQAQFGIAVDLAAMRKMRVQMVVGEVDTETWEITIGPKSRFWMPRVNEPGVTRIERLQSLRRSFEQHGIAVRLDMVPGVGHDGFALLEPVRAFFAENLRSEHE